MEFIKGEKPVKNKYFMISINFMDQDYVQNISGSVSKKKVSVFSSIF